MAGAGSDGVVERAEVLRHLEEPVLRELQESSRTHRLAAGELLLAEGDEAQHLFLIRRGQVEVVRGLPHAPVRIATRRAGEWVGESAAIEKTRNASVRAVTAVEALAFERALFVEKVSGCREAVLDLVRMVDTRLRESDARLLDALREQVDALARSNDALSRENRDLRDALDERDAFESFVGTSAGARAARDTARHAALSDAPVLLLGETGTGKEVLAQAIHASGSRRRGRFVPLHCGLLNEGLLESELFGYARGAFTGAHHDKPGLVEAAHGGTLFLDEIGEMTPVAQISLLRFLQVGEFRRLGETRDRKVDVRVIAATHQGLDAAVEQESFRRDLMYRLDVIRISIPPLRERAEDLPALIRHCLERTAARLGVEPLRPSEGALEQLLARPFPGNVRELENDVERLYVFCRPGSVVTEADFRPHAGGRPPPDATLSEALRRLKIEMIERALRESEGNRTRAARRLGVQRSNLARWLRELDIRA